MSRFVRDRNHDDRRRIAFALRYAALAVRVWSWNRSGVKYAKALMNFGAEVERQRSCDTAMRTLFCNGWMPSSVKEVRREG